MIEEQLVRIAMVIKEKKNRKTMKCNFCLHSFANYCLPLRLYSDIVLHITF